jgi:Protein of unknown function (DUF1749)
MVIRGDDDYFSSDLSDELLAPWQLFESPVLVLPSANDEFVPEHIDKAALLEKWMALCPKISRLSALIPGANHSVDDAGAQDWLADRVVRFLERLNGQDGP